MHQQRTFPKITAGDAEIAAALEYASIPTLMMSMIHMRGDAALLDGEVRPQIPPLNEVQGLLSEADKAAVRRDALAVICDYRDRGCTLPAPPDAATQRRMMAFIAGIEDIGDDYVEMMREEMELDGCDSRQIDIEAAALSPERKADFHVVIVGAGMSGVLTGVRLKRAGVPFTIIEKNADVGGTWYENRYPGCRVDIANHFYSYSFEPGHAWSEFFCQRKELQAYFRRVAEDHGVLEHIRFGTTVAGARFCESDHCWSVRIEHGGKEETLKSNVLVSAVGQLNRPKIPALPGRDLFTGAQTHTGAWDESLDLRGKRVVVVGSGASAFQLVPAIAGEVASMTVFQRTAPWIAPNPHYHEKIDEGTQWCLNFLPYYQSWYRFLLFWPGSDGIYPALQIDPEWEDGGRSVNAFNKEVRNNLEAAIRAQVQDPTLLEQVIPAYPPLATRLLQDNGSWFRALQQDKVSLISRGVAEVTATGVVDEGGEHHDCDVIVWATGFQANDFLAPMQIENGDGQLLSARWGQSPDAYLGITTPEFPNLYMLYGPNTNLAHAGSIVFNSECQSRYILSAIKQMLEKDISRIECRAETGSAFQQKLRDTLAGLVWSLPGINSWYKNNAGEVTATLPWLLADYWRWTRTINLDEYHVVEGAGQ